MGNRCGPTTGGATDGLDFCFLPQGLRIDIWMMSPAGEVLLAHAECHAVLSTGHPAALLCILNTINHHTYLDDYSKMYHEFFRIIEFLIPNLKDVFTAVFVLTLSRAYPWTDSKVQARWQEGAPGGRGRHSFCNFGFSKKFIFWISLPAGRG